MIEGGAEVEKVCNFAWFNSAVASLRINFQLASAGGSAVFRIFE
jgi:hypothetical protein